MTLGRDPRTREGQVRVRHQGNDGDVEDLREEHLVLCPGETPSFYALLGANSCRNVPLSSGHFAFFATTDVCGYRRRK